MSSNAEVKAIFAAHAAKNAGGTANNNKLETVRELIGTKGIDINWVNEVRIGCRSTS
jgi:hypothetical protein